MVDHGNSGAGVVRAERDSQDFSEYNQILNERIGYNTPPNEHSTTFVYKNNGKVIGGVRVAVRGKGGLLPTEMHGYIIHDDGNICEICGLVVRDDVCPSVGGRYIFIDLLKAAYKFIVKENITFIYASSVRTARRGYERVLLGKVITDLPFKTPKGVTVTLMAADLLDKETKARWDAL